jgi:large subunit ribosomal protein L25
VEILKLTTRLRTGTGKSYTRKVRSQGWIPAVYYGHDRESKAIEVDAHEFSIIVRHKKLNHLVDLGLTQDNGDSVTVIKEIQRHVIKDDLFFHIDFQHVAMDEKISVQCPLKLTGIAIGVKEDAGILNQMVRSLTISCLPSDIPDFIEVDISDLKIGQALHVRDVKAEIFEIKDSPEDVIAVVGRPRAEEVVAPTAEAVAEGEEATAEGEKAVEEGAKPATEGGKPIVEGGKATEGKKGDQSKKK